jgi:hypothetical protein
MSNTTRNIIYHTDNATNISLKMEQMNGYKILLHAEWDGRTVYDISTPDEIFPRFAWNLVTLGWEEGSEINADDISIPDEMFKYSYIGD